MDYISPSIPEISISLAPPEEPSVEPVSPFASFTFCAQGDEDGFRPVHLTPPPTVSSFRRPHSPLNPADEPMPGKGLDGDRFQNLLNAVRSGGARKGTDLRKAIALKVHKNKQAERRALFLSKVQAPPSPTATLLPKTPPESPAIFHYSLPSPGLVSPLALFETLKEDNYAIRVEQVDFRLPESTDKQRKSEEAKLPIGLPSLDQISARLIPRTKTDDIEYAFNAPITKQPRPSIDVGRLRMPVRTREPPASHLNESAQPSLPPKSPLLHVSPELRVTTLVVPRTQTTSAAQLTETNLNALNARDQKAHAMLSTIRRRTLSSDFKATRPSAEDLDAQYKWRRRSAPADIMPFKPRSGFEHPVLALPGAF